jgi:hypothetical protein
VLLSPSQHWDGLRTKQSDRVLVLAATNRPMDLDEAVVRRMPRRIFVPLPDAVNRERILQVRYGLAGCWLAGWLVGWLADWLVGNEEQLGPEEQLYLPRRHCQLPLRPVLAPAPSLSR